MSILAAVVVVGAGVAAAAAPSWFERTTGAPREARWFGGYYDVTLESGERLATSPLGDAEGSSVLSFVVAAAEDECTPTWGVAYDLDTAASDLHLDRRAARMRELGQRVVVSFGGAANSELALACENVDSLRDAYAAVLGRYDVDVMDLDIEGDALADEASSTRRARAVAALQRDRPDLEVWLTLPVAADDGLTASGLDAVSVLLDAGVDLSGVNAMTMNYNSDLGDRTMGEAAIDALEATAAQLTALYADAEVPLADGGVWAMLGATPMIGRNDVSGEIFTLDDARLLNAFAQEHGMARLSMWSLNRDRTCGSNYADDTVVSNECSGVEQAGESFATVLSAGYETLDPDPAPNATVRTDDPNTSPYPVWSSTVFYSAGVFVVWHGGVYVSKWWVDGGPRPDDPTIAASASAWTYLGPVLSDDTPFTLPTLPEGTYPTWDAEALYNQGDRVMYNGTGYEAKWWSKGLQPDRSVLDRDYSPWRMITE